METIILASASPRRGEYMRLLGLPFTAVPPEVNEDFDTGKDPALVAEELARRKVRAAAERLEDALWVCGADTLVTLDGTIYGKPRDRADARRMLDTLQGRDHKVVSAVALYSGRAGTVDCRSSESHVSFAPLDDAEIEWYLDSGEWNDAAGAYKIQGRAACFITRIEGSYSSIVGLPLREFFCILKDNNYPYIG